MNSISPRVRSIITIVLLLLTFVSPSIGLVGVIVMWLWTSWKKWVKTLITIPFVIAIFLTIIGFSFVLSYSFLFRPYQANGNAMNPTYRHGAYLFSLPYVSEKKVITKGDIVVFRAPPDPEKDYIKRVIATPGDNIMIQGGQVFLNGQKLDESKYTLPNTMTNPGKFIQEGKSIKVPTGQYFVMGDNRSFSTDSREWGFVPQESFVSKVTFCYWNCGK